VLGVGSATSDALPGAGGQVNHNIDHAKAVVHLPSCSRQCIRSGRLVFVSAMRLGDLLVASTTQNMLKRVSHAVTHVD